MNTPLNRSTAPSLTDRMRAAAVRGQTAALEMQEAVAEWLALANEVEDFAERQESALIRLRGPSPSSKPVASPNLPTEEEMDEEEEARSVAKIVGIVGRGAAK